ncbi:ribonuclease VapC [Nocardiopsis terrae]|uniref:Ribonuclease VapC n=1 Tax=Nocardiopsis terrae TaxID=372655 RepID=A0ABR9HEP3_9ACTN|nr:type II toxin-antitoxin system VapC family toxin [Nocardiopsis terrae]MBE1457495.1 putative nucleic acid-binding protein [Nocardiopsis terrae]GHC85836.1 ribonuclease VapC [Nocardiopsis terrae]
MIVVDTSVLIDLYLGSPGHTSTVARRVVGANTEWYAPSHQPLELLSSLRGLVLGRKVSLADAEAARKLYGLQAITHVGVVGSVADRVWELRHDLTAYDAAYVAVAEALDCALVTGDARLAAAPGLRCEVRVIR